MYYVLDCERCMDDEGGHLEVDDGIPSELDLECWAVGLPVDVAVAEPFELSARAIRGYAGAPADFYDFRVPLMSGRMVEALRQCGVDNLQIYPALAVERKKGTRWPLFVANIIGRVAAADRVHSEWTFPDESGTGEDHFEKLVVNRDAAAGLWLFRLAENLRTILVHERIKTRLETLNLIGVAFVEPQDWQT